MKLEFLNLLRTILFLPDKVNVLPRHIQLDVSTRCNLNCSMCYAKKVVNESDKYRFMVFDEFKNILDLIRPFSVNLAASGEPLLNPDIFKIIEYAKNKKTQVIISTNFVAADRKTTERIVNSGIDILKISVDGASKEIYEQIRGTYFDKLCENLSYLEEIMTDNKQNVTRIRIDYVILKTNADDIVGMLEFCKKYGIKHIFYRICDPRGWNINERENLLEGSYENVIGRMRDALKLSRKLGIETNLIELIKKRKFWKFIYGKRGEKGLNALDKPVCLLPWLQMFGSIYGDTSCCCSIYPSKEKNFGNLFSQDIYEAWNNDEWVNMRRIFKDKLNYERFEGCRYCIPMDRIYIFSVIRMFPGYILNLFNYRKKK